MVQRSRFIKRIRELGYRYKAQQKRTNLFRKSSGLHYLSVPMRKELDDVYVRSALRQAGCSEEDIEKFIDS